MPARTRRTNALFAASILTAFMAVASWDVFGRRQGADLPMLAKPATAGLSIELPEATVYATVTGRKYHREGCQHLRLSSRSMRLSVAKEAGFTPCLTCQPWK